MADRQSRGVILEGCGSIDPEIIEAYIASGGYAGRQAILRSTPEGVISRVEEADLLGHGGAGFPVARKWRIARQSQTHQRFVVANAYDADLLSPIGRTLLEQMPHRVIEGLIIAAFAVGATEGIIYCRGEAAMAIARARQAISQAEAKGLLGPNALGPGQRLRVRVVSGWAGFIGGEETAAIAAIEGRRAMPSQRPPYPAESGLLGLPTVISSAETLAILPALMAPSPRDIEADGSVPPRRDDANSHDDRSTLKDIANFKVFSIRSGGRGKDLIELPLGLSLRQILERTGHFERGRKLKAIQIGGPAGACIPESNFDLPVTFESLRDLGAHLGSGRIELLDSSVCMAGFASDTLNYLYGEACGKCVPCRIGIKRMFGIVEGITSELGKGADLETLKDLSANIPAGSICGFGVIAPSVVTSTLRYFESDYISHIEEKKCPTGRCSATRQFGYQRRAVL